MADPIYTNYPEATSALQNKYQRFGPALSQLPVPIVRSLAQFDLQRVQRGQNPLSERETTNVLQTAITGQAATPQPQQSPWEALKNTLNPFAGRDNPIVRDIATIGSSVPRLPLALAREVQSLKDLPEVLGQATRQASNPIEAVGNIAMSPGIRFIPGSYVLGNLAGGTEYDAQGKALVEGSPGELARHPLFTALDVLPYAEGAAKLTPAAKAAEAERAGIVASGAAPYDVPKLRPMRTALTQQLNDLGGLEPNRIGRVTQGVGAGVGRTRIGQLGQEAFGRQYGRIPSAMKAARDVDVAERMNPKSHLTGPGYSDDPYTQAARESVGLAEKYKITPERTLELTRMMGRDPEKIATLSGPERLFVNQVEDLNRRYAEFGKEAGLLGEADIAGSPEVFDIGTANKIRRSQRFVEHTSDVARFRNPVHGLGADEIFSDIKGSLDDPLLSKKRRLTAVESRAYALHRMGYDVDSLLEGIGKARIGRMDVDEVARIADDTARVRPLAPMEDVTGIVRDLRQISRSDPQVAKLSEALRSGRWSDAARHLRDIRSRTTNILDDIGVDSDGLKATIQRQRRADNFVRHTEADYGTKRLGVLERYRTHLETTNVPQRFRSLVEDETRNRVKEHIENVMPGTVATLDVDEALRLADENNFSMIHGLDEAEYRGFKQEARDTWMQMKRDGIDPVYVHRTTPTQARQLAYPRVVERELTPSQVRATQTDFTPWVEDVTVALEHQGMEWLVKRGSEQFIDDIVTRYGMDEALLRERYLPAARAAHELNPALDVRAYMQDLIKREWVEFNPSEFITWGSPKLKEYSDNIMVPRPLEKNIRRMHVPPEGRLTQTMDPVMKVFRTALLPLSPRWHVYNILGGGMVTGARTGPRALGVLREAWEMARNAELPEGIPRGYGTAPRDVIQWDATAKLGDKVGAAFHYVGGQRLREFWDQAQRAREVGGKVIQKSYDMNGFFDDFYRSVSYLYGKNKAERFGLSEAAAKSEGIALTRKVMQNWDEITPIERSVMRYVFPFYGWMNHIMRYVASYPFDHPIRTSVMAQFARNELDDMGTGLPQEFLNMFFIGDVGSDGKVKSINTAGMNPFSDVANYFTLAGFTGNVNPIISSVLTTLGVDTGRGGPTLYPNLEYDPQTGRLAANNGNLLTNFAQAAVPQTRVLAAATGMSSEWKELLRRNPEAAGRMMWSQLGIPVIARNVPLYEEQFKGELARTEAQDTALRTSLKTGNQLQGYPDLNAFMGQVRQLQGEGNLDEYTPQVETPSAIEVAQQSLTQLLGVG